MKGFNAMVLNEATMIEAVQEFLDQRTTTSFGKITSINWKDNQYTVQIDCNPAKVEGLL